MRSATPLRKALESVLATARRSMSIACTCSAPLRASSMASIPVPQPMSRQRLPSPMWFWKRYFQTRKLPWVGTKTPGSQTISGISSGYRRRPRSSVHGRSDGWRGEAGVQRAVGRAVGGLGHGPRAGRHVAHARARAGDVLGPGAAAAADDLGALLAPARPPSRRTARRRRSCRSSSRRR